MRNTSGFTKEELPLEARQAMGHYVIRNRGPALIELTEGLEENWLGAMGYIHLTRSPRTGLVT